MRLQPSFEEFRKGFLAGRAQVVWTTLVADLETPVSAMLKLADGRRNSFLLESVEGGAVRGRYSFIGLKPDLVWRCFGDKAEINRRARVDPEAFEPAPGGALTSLRAVIEESRIELPAKLPPMASGLFGYIGYDMVRLMERLPDKNPDELGIPDGMFVRPTVVAVFDRLEDVVTVITPVRPGAGVDAAAAYDQAAERLGEVLGDQVGDDLRVGVAAENVALGLELAFEGGVVFDDAVVDDGDRAVAAEMGMGVDVGGAAVGGPAGVADAGGAANGVAFEDAA